MDPCLLCYRTVSISSTNWVQDAHWVSVLELLAQYRRAGTGQGLERQLSELRCRARIHLKHEDMVARKIENASSVKSLFFLFLPISMNTVSRSHLKLSVVLHAYKKFSQLSLHLNSTQTHLSARTVIFQYFTKMTYMKGKRRGTHCVLFRPFKKTRS